MANLAIFDVDGTLTETNDIDTECFLEAFTLEFGAHEIDSDWSHYENTTDRGIATELLRRIRSREAVENEIVSYRRRFIEILDARMTTANEIPGAARFLEFLQQRGWTVVLCTGAWRDSALMKLSRAGFPDDLALVSSDTLISREEILKEGIALAAEGGGAPLKRVVAFGDAVWDVRAARNVGIPFIGVGSRAVGAESTIVDYVDTEAVLALMAEARAPR